jgi:hypothetical protein
VKINGSNSDNKSSHINKKNDSFNVQFHVRNLKCIQQSEMIWNIVNKKYKQDVERIALKSNNVSKKDKTDFKETEIFFNYIKNCLVTKKIKYFFRLNHVHIEILHLKKNKENSQVLLESSAAQ